MLARASRVPLLCSFAAALLAPAWVTTVRADDEARGAFRLVWVRGDGTDSCADGVTIAQGVNQRLGKQVFSEPARRSIEAVLQHEGDSWEAHLYVRDEDGKLAGSRILTSRAPTCAPIQAAATLAIALTIDPDAAFRPPPPAPSTPGSAPALAPVSTPTPPAATGQPPPLVPAPAPPPPALAPPAPAEVPCRVGRPCPPTETTPPPHTSTGSAAVLAVAGLGLLPSTAPGSAVAAEVPVYRWLRASAGVLYLPEQKTGDGDFAFGLTAVWLGACANATITSRIDLSVCANADAGAIHAVVLALEPLRAGDHAWAGASLGATVRVRLVGPMQAEIGAEMVVPLTRNVFALEDGTPVFQQGPVTGVPFAGLGMSFP